MMNAQATLGQRIVEAARLAMLVHLSQLRQEASQQQTPGGAGAACSTDGALRVPDDRRQRSFYEAEEEAA